MDRRTCVATVGATLAGVGLAGCSGESNGENDDESDETDDDDELDWENLEAELGETPDSVELVDSYLVETEEGDGTGNSS